MDLKPSGNSSSISMNVDGLVLYDTGPPTQTPPQPLPTEPAGPNESRCELCNRPFEDDIFCNWHGPVMGKWLCDECFNDNRGQGMPTAVATALYKKPMDERLIQAQIDIVELAIKNLAEIKWIESNDAAGSYRNVDLNLTFREARPIYKALLEVLRHKLAQNESFPA